MNEKIIEKARGYVTELLAYSEPKIIGEEDEIAEASVKVADYATQVIEERTEAEYDIPHTGLTSPGYLSLDTETNMSKKGNVSYWDAIDALAEGLVKALVELSTTPVTLGNEFLEPEDDVLEMGKMVTEFAIFLLQEEFGAVYPYVEGDC